MVGHFENFRPFRPMEIGSLEQPKGQSRDDVAQPFWDSSGRVEAHGAMFDVSTTT